ncbi:MAG: hypothetical protein IJC71_07730 [Clostridia bacterium]|nr:hypothetical protein [Clostridia bacterium]
MCCNNNGSWGVIIIAVIIAYLLINNRFDGCGCDNGCNNNGCGGYLGSSGGCGCH